MVYRQLARGILRVLLVALAAGVFAFMPSGHAPRNDTARASGQVAPVWQQANSSGFGNPSIYEISALAIFNDYLYAGTSNAIDGAQIFRSPDGTTWSPVTQPGFGIAHDIAPPAILDLTVFNGRLYASTGRGDGPAQIWRTLDGLNWAPMVITGFSDPDTVDITVLVEYNGLLVAAATNLLSGAQIWRSYTGDNNSWTQVAPAVPGTAVAGVTGLGEFDGGLYAAVESEAPAQIWNSYGGDWTTIVDDGFGDSKTTMTGGMAVFAGSLYIGAGNQNSGAQLWRSGDGAIWQPAITPGFGSADNQKVEGVFVFQNQLYVSVQNAQTGIEIWRSADGQSWEQANQDGFGDGNNSGSNAGNATAEFQGQLYVGTVNVASGGAIWRMQQPYGVTLSPDQGQSGLPGQTVSYSLSITNSGSLTDTFDLATAGQTWPTTLSTVQVSLGPAAGTTFTVTVAIPPGTAVQAVDSVTVTAVSQGDNRQTDAIVLTTTATETPQQTYLPVALADTLPQ